MAKRRCDRRPLLAVVVLGAASSMAIHSAMSMTSTSSHPASSPDDVVRSWPTASGRVGGRRSAGMHVCTCLADDDDDHDDDDDFYDPPRRLRWLHIPKTGTSFVSTLWSYAASDERRYIDLNVNAHMCDNHANGRVVGTSMYDFVLMRRYPWEMYGAPNMIHPSPRNSSSRADPSGGGGRPTTTTDGGAVPLGLVGGTQHLPLSRGYAWDRRGSEVYDHNFTVVAFFRRPDDRIVSAYYDGRHANGFVGELYREVVKASTQRRRGEHSCTIEKNVTTRVGTETTTSTTTTTYRNPLECYARFPGIAGCASRMLTGGTCADGASRGDGVDGVEEAVEIVGHLDFVGLTEEWDESVCHFHRLFGRRRAAVVDSDFGDIDDEDDGGTRRRIRRRRRRAHPLQGEFGNVHKSAKKKVFDVEDLNGFLDAADEAVYEAARLRFEKMVGHKGGERCHRYMTWEEIDAAAEGGAGHYLPDLVRDEDGRVCEPMTCSDLRKQCGEWDDGCGRTVICGLCDPGRTGLPSTWRVKCVEGECIDYCPPWDERGLWFLSDDSPSSDMKKIGEAMGISDVRRHLSPVDAVRICQMACDTETQSRRGLESFVNTGLCRCGKPAKILSKNLTSLDFSKAHDMDAACHTNKARKDAGLTSWETQPVCCPYLDRQTKIPIGWKRLYTFGAFNVEGEYFDHVRMECGAFKECELAGRVRGAEVIVFDSFNKLCYFVRNVFDLKDMYTVTKDNYMRYTMDLRSRVRPFIARTKDGRLSKPA